MLSLLSLRVTLAQIPRKAPSGMAGTYYGYVHMMTNRLRVRVAKEEMVPCHSLPGSGFELSCASVAAANAAHQSKRA